MRQGRGSGGPDPESGNVHAGDGAGDDEALDLGGAFEDRVDLLPTSTTYRTVR